MKNSNQPPRYKVTLTEQERSMLKALIRKGKTTAFKNKHARVLLLCDAGEHANTEKLKVEEVAKVIGVTTRTIEHIKERFVNEGVDAAINRKPRSRSRKIIFDGAFSARLTALACSAPPEGRARWTLRLLAEKVVELEIAPKVSPMSIYLTLKKTNLSLT